ncbi:hypothetical protein [Paenibacillus tyrfis]|uniref:hypothetical protein n=1 Tax=Paenibacillus tyrfis TaxID=1501230 RepID=UPI00209D444E|nr:hypothetical protein [Paenibacillus tyrfis]MCP1306450.1 hypothetical protein [Paenibacillus tyrfis]
MKSFLSEVVGLLLFKQKDRLEKGQVNIAPSYHQDQHSRNNFANWHLVRGLIFTECGDLSPKQKHDLANAIGVIIRLSFGLKYVSKLKKGDVQDAQAVALSIIELIRHTNTEICKSQRIVKDVEFEHSV